MYKYKLTIQGQYKDQNNELKPIRKVEYSIGASDYFALETKINKSYQRRLFKLKTTDLRNEDFSDLKLNLKLTGSSFSGLFKKEYSLDGIIIGSDVVIEGKNAVVSVSKKDIDDATKI